MTLAPHPRADAELRLGLAAALGAQALWGVLPLYLSLIGFAAPPEILANRILWCAPATLAIVALSGGLRPAITALRQPGLWRWLLVSALAIGCNWWIYVWAIANARVIEASLAYFLTPLVGVGIGVLAFGERLSRAQAAAIALAALGVVGQGVAVGQLPVVALALCASWSVYAYVRKRAPAPAAAGLLAETLYLAPLAGLGLVLLATSGAPLAFDDRPTNAALLALSGPATAVPLILFALSARRLRFSTQGLIQYLAPSMQFGFGVALGEPLTPLRAISFAVIWLGLAIYSLETLRLDRGGRA